VTPRTDAEGAHYIQEVGLRQGYAIDLNRTTGLMGAFYHGTEEERRSDLLQLVQEIVEDRIMA